MIGNYEEYPEMLNRLFLEDKTKGFDAKQRACMQGL